MKWMKSPFRLIVFAHVWGKTAFSSPVFIQHWNKFIWPQIKIAEAINIKHEHWTWCPSFSDDIVDFGFYFSHSSFIHWLSLPNGKGFYSWLKQYAEKKYLCIYLVSQSVLRSLPTAQTIFKLKNHKSVLFLLKTETYDVCKCIHVQSAPSTASCFFLFNSNSNGNRVRVSLEFFIRFIGCSARTSRKSTPLRTIVEHLVSHPPAKLSHSIVQIEYQTLNAYYALDADIIPTTHSATAMALFEQTEESTSEREKFFH